MEVILELQFEWLRVQRVNTLNANSHCSVDRKQNLYIGIPIPIIYICSIDLD